MSEEADILNVLSDEVRPGVRAVEAEAGTGWRYAVVATRLPPGIAAHEGGTHMVTVLSPFRAAYVMQGPETGGTVFPSYVAEKFMPRDAAKFENPRNLVALTLCVARALGREADVSAARGLL